MSSNTKQKPTVLTLLKTEIPLSSLVVEYKRSSKIKAKLWKHVCHVTVCTNFMFAWNLASLARTHPGPLLILHVIKCYDFEPLFLEAMFSWYMTFSCSLRGGQKIGAPTLNSAIISCEKTLPLNQVESAKVSRFSFTKMNTFTHLVHRVERQTPKYIMQQSTKPQLPHRDFNRQMGGKTKKNREHVIRGNLEINTRIEELTLQK